MSQRFATYNRAYTTRSCRQQCFYGIGATTENVLAAAAAAAAAAVSNVSGDGHEVAAAAQDFTSNREDNSRLHNYKILQQQIIGHTIQSVEDIEKWLRYTSENISNPVINPKNNVLRAGLARSCPNEQLSEASDKELLTDIELAAKKLNVDYVAILNELQNSKVLPTNEKDDGFVLPDLRLDDLILTQDTSASESKSEAVIDKLKNKDVAKAVKTAQLKNKFEISAQNRKVKENETELVNKADGESVDATLTMSIQDLSIDNDSSDGSCDPNIEPNSNKSENFNSLVVTQEKSSRYNTRSKNTNSSSVKSKFETNSSVKSKFEKNSSNVKSKFKPSIIKRKRKVNNQENTIKTVKNKTKVSTKAVLHEKSLNENNYTIRKKCSPSESSGHESDDLGKGRNPLFVTAQELAVSKALEEAGIPDGSLEYFYNSENMKTWRCHLKGCGRHFVKLCYLKVHLMAHMNVKPFKCDYPGCSWAFCSEFKLKRHKETHLNKKDFVCLVPGCQRRFTTIYNLASHEKLHKRPNKIACQVSDCNAKFPTKRALESHMRSHDESLAPYACNYANCGKRFYSNNALMSHQRCHSYSPEDLACSWPGCGKTFDLPCRKKAHMRSHTGQKPYACTFERCNWAFSTSSKLNRHQKKHTNERKYACDEEGCGKTFLRSQHLRDHKITHDKERTYFTCHYCSNCFYAKSSLYAHIKGHLRMMNGEDARRPASSRRKRASVGSSESESASTEEMEESSLPPAGTYIIEEIPVSNVLVHKMYKCPVEHCSKWYSYRSSLRVHLRKHASPLAESQNDDEESTSSKSNEGAARTEFTRDYVLSLKPDRRVVDSNEVGIVELSEGLLRDAAALPSVFCQEDVDLPTYQIFILDTSPIDVQI